MIQNDKKRVKQLEKTIVALDTSFDEGNDCIDPFTKEVILDNEYDALEQELLTICPESKIFTSVTSSTSKTTKKRV